MRNSFEEVVLFLKSNPDKKIERDDKLKYRGRCYRVLGEVTRFDEGFEIDYSVKGCW